MLAFHLSDLFKRKNGRDNWLLTIGLVSGYQHVFHVIMQCVIFLTRFNQHSTSSLTGQNKFACENFTSCRGNQILEDISTSCFKITLSSLNLCLYPSGPILVQSCRIIQIQMMLLKYRRRFVNCDTDLTNQGKGS